jgi:DNA-binding transcriptional MocR family regulator
MSVGSDAYGSALGFPPLRQQISLLLASQQIQASEHEIMMTFGANHALDLVIRAFLGPGDVVLVDEPGYYPLFAKLKLAQVHMVGVKRNPDGPDLEDFAAKAKAHFPEQAYASRPRFFFTQSIGHNPTGSSINLSVAHGLLKIAAAHNMVVVEDDPFCDLVQTSRLAALDQLEHVISVGTFSKTLSASLRTGYIAAKRERIEALAELKMLTTVNSSGYVERLLQRLLVEGHYKRHLKRLSQRVDNATQRVTKALADGGWRLFSSGGAGYYLYLMLPDGIDDIEVARLGAQKGLFIAPGSVFCLDKSNPLAAGIRVNITRADDPRFFDFLSGTIRPQMGARVGAARR